jgi:ABC-2 type transport system permease protein
MILHLLRAEILKLRSTRMWMGLLFGAVALTGLGAIATLAIAGTLEGAQAGLTPVRSVSDISDLVYASSAAALFAMILGAVAITGEYRSGTIAGTFLATPSRTPVIVTKAAAAAAVGFGFGVVCALIPVVSAEVYLGIKGLPLTFGMPVVISVLVIAVTGASSAAIGTGVGAAIRSQLVAILALLGWGLVVEQIIGGLLPDYRKWLPFIGAQASLSRQDPTLLSPLPGGLLLIAYVVVAVIAGVLVTRQRDIS